MAIGVNWKDIWKDVWKPVWQQTPVVPVVVLSLPTVVPGSITATGARGRVTATEYA